MFDWFSLDVIYYPVSAIMWVWYKAFAFLLGPSNFFAWALSVMFLVFTLRAILYKPFVRQIRTTRQMQELQPQIKALQKKYGKDRQRMAVEMQKLQKEHGFNPVLGCLPMLAQLPVFLGLYHVLRSFNRTQGGFGQPKLSVELNRSLGNYVFSATDVGHFLDANLFGAPLGATMIQKTGLDAFTEFSRPAVIAVGVPLMILAGIATHFNSRASVARQSVEAAANPQTAMMNKMALYLFPLGVVVGGPFLPLAIILYWVANNIWTYAQQHYVFGKIEKEEEAKAEAEKERRSKKAPLSGARPKWPGNYDPTVEFRKAKAQDEAGNRSAASAGMLKVWDYLEHSGKRPARSDGDTSQPGGLVAEVATWLGPKLKANHYEDQALRVFDAAASAVKDDFGTEPSWLQLRQYFFHSGHAQDILLAQKRWTPVQTRSAEDLKLLPRWESADLPEGYAGEENSSPDARSFNRFLWNFRLAHAEYELKNFDAARAAARDALAAVDGWSDEYRGSQKSVFAIPGGYVAGIGVDRAVLLLIASGGAGGPLRQRSLRGSEKQTRLENSAAAVELLGKEVEAAKATPSAGPAAVEYLAEFYRAGLAQAASLYGREVPDAIQTAITAESVDVVAGADPLAVALEKHAEERLVAAEAEGGTSDQKAVSLVEPAALNPGSNGSSAKAPAAKQGQRGGGTQVRRQGQRKRRGH